MIPYEDLVAALTSWRQRNGLPTGGAEYVAPPAFDVDIMAGESGEASEVDALAVEEIYDVGEVDELEVEDGSHDEAALAADPHTFDESAEAGAYDDGGYDDGAYEAAAYDDGAYEAAASDDGEVAADGDAAASSYDDDAAASSYDDASGYATDDELVSGQETTAYAEAEDAGAFVIDDSAAEAVDAGAFVIDDGPADETMDADESTMVAQVGDLSGHLADGDEPASEGMDLGTLDDDATSIGSLPTDDDDDRS